MVEGGGVGSSADGEFDLGQRSVGAPIGGEFGGGQAGAADLVGSGQAELIQVGGARPALAGAGGDGNGAAVLLCQFSYLVRSDCRNDKNKYRTKWTEPSQGLILSRINPRRKSRIAGI